MQTIVEISSTTTGGTFNVATTLDPIALPVPGDDVALPTPIAAPAPNATQQVTISNRIFRYTKDSTGAVHLYVLLVTASPIA
jgi:hypothetical protein